MAPQTGTDGHLTGRCFRRCPGSTQHTGHPRSSKPGQSRSVKCTIRVKEIPLSSIFFFEGSCVSSAGTNYNDIILALCKLNKIRTEMVHHSMTWFSLTPSNTNQCTTSPSYCFCSQMFLLWSYCYRGRDIWTWKKKIKLACNMMSNQKYTRPLNPLNLPSNFKLKHGFNSCISAFRHSSHNVHKKESISNYWNYIILGGM